MSEDLKYTNPALVTDRQQTAEPAYGRTASGYGGKIPTRHMIRYAGRWRRVYAMLYSNSGTAYVVVNGEDHILDIDTEYSLRG